MLCDDGTAACAFRDRHLQLEARIRADRRSYADLPATGKSTVSRVYALLHLTCKCFPFTAT